MFSDFTDKKAQASSTSISLGQALFVSIPAVLGLISLLTNFWTTVFSGMPYLMAWLKFFISALLFLVSIKAIVSKRKVYSASNSFLAEPGTHTSSSNSLKEYTYANTFRRIAKIAFVPLLVACCWSLWNSLPCGLFKDNITGKIITDHVEINDGVVQIRGCAGDIISKQIEPLDDDNVFFSDLKWWASRPSQIILKSKECSVQIIDIEDGKEVLRGEKTVAVWVSSCN